MPSCALPNPTPPAAVKEGVGGEPVGDGPVAMAALRKDTGGAPCGGGEVRKRTYRWVMGHLLVTETMGAVHKVARGGQRPALAVTAMYLGAGSGDGRGKEGIDGEGGGEVVGVLEGE